MQTISINGHDLTFEEIYKVSCLGFKEIKVEIEDDALSKMKKSRAFVDAIVDKGEPVYGINTGFGALSDKHISTDDLSTLQYNLIRSHCTGVGRPFDKEITRAIMLLRANCLTSGFSGITPDTVQLLVDFLNHDIIPIVPEKGSVGASGDLAPLSHIALALIGEGEVFYKDEKMIASEAMKDSGLKPAELHAKDGLALINGTAVMAALGSLAFYKASKFVRIADICSAMTLEAVRGTQSAYDPDITLLKPHDGQIRCVQNLNRLLGDSEISHSHKDCGKVQDPYSLRCVPQVHGGVRQTLLHAEQVLKVEINSVTDNPLVFPDKDKVVSGGNFHGEAVALCMDYLTMGLSELANIAERRVEKMMNPGFSDLPAFLTKNSGLNSGLMIAQVTMAALASENKYLSHPASVDSIPTSTDKEDHVSMGVTSGRKLQEVLSNLRHCLAIELLCNFQGLSILRPLKSTPPIEEVYKLIADHVDPIEDDRVFAKDMAKIEVLIEDFSILNVVENKIGILV
jgi:histidine ammonia-lyase